MGAGASIFTYDWVWINIKSVKNRLSKNILRPIDGQLSNLEKKTLGGCYTISQKVVGAQD